MKLTRNKNSRVRKLNLQLDISEFSEINFQNHWALNSKSSGLETLYLRVAGYVVGEIEDRMMV